MLSKIEVNLLKILVKLRFSRHCPGKILFSLFQHHIVAASILENIMKKKAKVDTCNDYTDLGLLFKMHFWNLFEALCSTKYYMYTYTFQVETIMNNSPKFLIFIIKLQYLREFRKKDDNVTLF